MIADILLNIVYVFVLGITQLVAGFGDVTPNNNITTALTTISSYLSPLNNYLPFATILAIVAFDLTFEASYFLYKLIKWGYQKIPGIN